MLAMDDKAACQSLTRRTNLQLVSLSLGSMLLAAVSVQLAARTFVKRFVRLHRKDWGRQFLGTSKQAVMVALSHRRRLGQFQNPPHDDACQSFHHLDQVVHDSVENEEPKIASRISSSRQRKESDDWLGMVLVLFSSSEDSTVPHRPYISAPSKTEPSRSFTKSTDTIQLYLVI
ncbi:hypothetical protein Ae201684_006278 [Aphanomyces euteiches]|uniref:Uncharacterized protein n=1 Tax=Aphanomyces euteiches TaxID=100861 RepID=A0A6G0XCM8_9STRA|nr:hypothetical protein Ae201684_006278 [Aphanomyces euteiches]